MGGSTETNWRWWCPFGNLVTFGICNYGSYSLNSFPDLEKFRLATREMARSLRLRQQYLLVPLRHLCPFHHLHRTPDLLPTLLRPRSNTDRRCSSTCHGLDQNSD